VKTSDDDLLVFTAAPLTSSKGRKLQNASVELVRAKAKNGRMDSAAVLKELGRRDILSVLLEAGPTLNGAALTANAVHKLFLFYAPKMRRQSCPLRSRPQTRVTALAKCPDSSVRPGLRHRSSLEERFSALT